MKSTTVREELVVALFEDAADIVTRLEALAPVMADTRFSLAEAARELAAQLKPFQDQMRQIAASEQYKAIHYVRQQVEHTSRVAQEVQTEALTKAGQAVLKDEVGATLQKLIASLQHIVRGVKRREAVLTHITTAVVAAASTAVLLMYVLPGEMPTQSAVSSKAVASVEAPAPVQPASRPEKVHAR